MAGPVVLVGMMGSGKTSVGRELASLLEWPWLDLDQALELRFRRSVAEQFALDGETVFRRRERALLREACGSGSRVVSTGGGVVLDPTNLELLKRNRTVYLQASPSVLAGRLGKAQIRRRPLLQGAGNDLEVVLRRLAKLRGPLYRSCAMLTVRTASASPSALAQRILGRLWGDIDRAA